MKLTKAQTRELQRLNRQGTVQVWRVDKEHRVYEMLCEKFLAQVAWAYPHSTVYCVPGKDTRGMFE